MKFLFQLTTAFMIVACVALTSCAGLRHKPTAAATPTPKKTAGPTPQTPAAPVAQTSKLTKSPLFSLSSLLPGPRVQVVKVREKDLKEQPTGHERALAFENQRKRGFWFFGGPVDFKEPTLPEPGNAMDGSLLPPRIP